MISPNCVTFLFSLFFIFYFFYVGNRQGLSFNIQNKIVAAESLNWNNNNTLYLLNAYCELVLIKDLDMCQPFNLLNLLETLVIIISHFNRRGN